MSSDNTGWQSPSGGDPSSHSPASGRIPQPGPAPAPQYGAYAPQSGQPAYGQQAPQDQGYTAGPQYSHYAQQAGAYPPGPAGFFVAPKPGIIPLRPLSITEIITGAFESLRANPRAMFLPALLVMGAAGLVSALATFISMNAFVSNLSSTSYYYDYDPSVSEYEVFGDSLSLLGGTFTSSLVTAAATALATAVLTGLLIVTVSRSVLGRIATPTEVWERTRPRIWALIGQSILIGLITCIAAALVILGVALLLAWLFMAVAEEGGSSGIVLLLPLGFLFLLLGVVAAAFLWVRLSVSGAALILENVGVWEGIRRSWQLTRTGFWRTLGLLLLVELLVTAVSYVLAMPIGLISGAGSLFVTGASTSALLTALTMFLSSLLSAVILPFSAAARALLYIDLRMRQEGLDVELRRSAGV
ncbi:hypothetical protein SAMN05216355_101330 [Actinomyces ruminicola]|uniref:DUF7847 domain-containing protein n=1 Tax=Actinomyces ruminicola TaxID=332524 RepID=A0A1G9ZPJ2_9ACTO|nr:glycerophosphoryl diester phosphodiesterase membrane domain-containing protein [Actinomyces ruminicola]SDN23114.1 hypothetical protein SAMN05216355_101330 [Actinomyces ruminicola]